MIRIKILIFFTVYLIVGQVVGQTAYIYTVYSQNEDFFLQTIPYDDEKWTSIGKTIVFNSDSTKCYEIPRHFGISPHITEIFLSNDGKTIVYVLNYEDQNKSIEVFKNGMLFKQYQLTDLIDCNSENEKCFLFYNAIEKFTWETNNGEVIYKEGTTDFEKALSKKATFLNNDTLYIFTKTNKLIKIDLNTANVDTTTSRVKIDEELFKQIKPYKIKYESFKASKYGLSNLANGKPFKDKLAKYLNMANVPEHKKKPNKYKEYYIHFEILVDKNGKALVHQIGRGWRDTLPEHKVKAFIEAQTFDTKLIPKQTDKWLFSSWVIFMNKNKKQAERERQKEILVEREAYKKQIVADSLNGLYIPKNIEECFIELNKILKAKDIETIKNLENRSKTISYHDGFGMWLRNNWGLWGGSRLQQYLIGKGLRHPDDMSAIILEFYYDWLNGQHDEWKKFEDK